MPVLVAYIQAHPNLKAIGTQHGGITGVLAEVLKKAGKKPGDIIVGGIDLAPATIDGLKSGYVSRDARPTPLPAGLHAGPAMRDDGEIQDARPVLEHRRRRRHAGDDRLPGRADRRGHPVSPIELQECAG